MGCIGWPSILRQWLLLLLLPTAVPPLYGSSVKKACSQQGHNPCGYTAIFSFGDSLADTGNSAFDPDGGPLDCTVPPYGMSFFHRPTGRCSDGRLVIDFIAENMGIPYLQPYWALRQQRLSSQLLRHGVNFAVAGSTALNASFFEDQGIETQTNGSLAVQIQWFKTLLPSLCPQGSRNCNLLATSLFVVGEIGGNDVTLILTDSRKSNDDVRAVFPMVIKAISAAVQDLISIGARTLVVPGNLPLGCNALCQKLFPETAAGQDIDREYYEPDTGCIRWINRLVEDYNRQLGDELERLRRSNPGAAIIYADYYRAALPIYRSPALNGFRNTLEACCGHYDSTAGVLIKCGSQSSAGACSDPSQYASWDAMHLTEAAYNVIAAGLLDGSSTIPTVSSLCPDCVAGRDVQNHDSRVATI